MRKTCRRFFMVQKYERNLPSSFILHPSSFILMTTVIIPARYASTRLPKKPLAMIAGMTMIERVYRQCQKASGIDAIFVATDHEAIVREVERFGGRAVMTPES